METEMQEAPTDPLMLSQEARSEQKRIEKSNRRQLEIQKAKEKFKQDLKSAGARIGERTRSAIQNYKAKQKNNPARSRASMESFFSVGGTSQPRQSFSRPRPSRRPHREPSAASMSFGMGGSSKGFKSRGMGLGIGMGFKGSRKNKNKPMRLF